jgi:FKBP-type peptidyl-prolyl cis-trans isomerase
MLRWMRPMAALPLGALLTACHTSPDPSPEQTRSAAPAQTQPAPAAVPSLRVATPIPAPDDVGKPPADAETTPSGVRSKVLKAGIGKDHPLPNDLFDIEYVVWDSSGKMFDRSVGTLQMRLQQLIPGWAEGVQLMVPGEKRRMWIPAALAYGDHPLQGQVAGDLTVDSEISNLLKKSASVPFPPAPSDVGKPPADAKKTASGLVYRVLKPGTGKTPAANATVIVNYSGWTHDGTPFDSTVTRGRPLTMRIELLIPGWSEGLKLMSEGEQARLWIPAKLAYGDKPARKGVPAGALVFDIELVSIK